MRFVLIASILLNLLLFAYILNKQRDYSKRDIIKKEIYSDGQNIKQIQDQNNKNRAEIYSNLLAVDSNDIVFFGTSITESFPVTEIFGSNVKNRGIAGNHLSHMAERLQGIIKGHPKKILLEGGINDLLNGDPVDSVFDHYKMIVEKIKAASPGTEIIIQSTFPTFYERGKFNHVVQILNDSLMQYASIYHIHYIDIYSMMDHPELYVDGLHPNARGYTIWRKLISSFIFNDTPAATGIKKED
jgi:lysophospholipase L1-like esterase